MTCQLNVRSEREAELLYRWLRMRFYRFGPPRNGMDLIRRQEALERLRHSAGRKTFICGDFNS